MCDPIDVWRFVSLLLFTECRLHGRFQIFAVEYHCGFSHLNGLTMGYLNHYGQRDSMNLVKGFKASSMSVGASFPLTIRNGSISNNKIPCNLPFVVEKLMKTSGFFRSKLCSRIILLYDG